MYDIETSQWIDYGKGTCSDDVIWIRTVKQLEECKIEVEFETKSIFEIGDKELKQI